MRERRASAQHPGPTILATYLAPVGIAAADFARGIALEPAVVEAILAGERSFDVPIAVRFARALGLPAERIVKLQTAYDFARARCDASLGEVGPLEVPPWDFDTAAALPGRLGATGNDADGEAFYFQQDAMAGDGDAYAGLHALWRGDALRVLDAAGAPLWTGPVMQNLDGRMLLPFVPPSEWRIWFSTGRSASMVLGPDHRAFLAKMHAR